jgi:hypothetical protein
MGGSWGNAGNVCLKSVLDLRPVYHRLEERIRAQAVLYWLALLLVRAAEKPTRQTWPAMRRELQRISIGTFTGPADTLRQRTDIPKTARDLLTALGIDIPRKIHELTTPADRSEPVSSSRRLETRPAASQPCYFPRS